MVPKCLVLLAGLAAAAAAAPAARAAPEDPWIQADVLQEGRAEVPGSLPVCTPRCRRVIDLTIPIWIPGITGTFASGATSVDIDRPDEDPITNAPEIASNIEFAFMGAFDAVVNRWVFHADAFGVSIEDTADFRVDALDAKATLTGAASRLLAGYRVLNPDDCECRAEVLLDLMAGVRLCYANIELDEPQGLAFDRDEFWVDPIVAARATFDLPGRIDFRVMADIGGFDVGSKLSWSATAEVIWNLSRVLSLSLGYTWLAVDYDLGKKDDRFVYDLDLRGPQLSITFHF